jgi:carbon monoxide dehydrogenase subunit G
MRATATFDLSASPDQVVTYLSNPRHMLLANHKGPVVEQSDLPVRAGSWSVLAFDQLRVRVQYTAFEPPAIVAASMTVSGRGSGGMNGSFVYQLSPIRESGGTRVTFDAESSAAWMPGLVSRLSWPLMWRRLRSRMERGSRTGA